MKKEDPSPMEQGDYVVTQSGSRPVPDPTVLTTQQLQREILMLKELIETRLDSYDTGIRLLQANADKAPSISVVEKSVESLRALHEEKFKSIAVQFSERDTRTEQTSRDSKVAVDAALQAAKEAVGEQNKSNAASIAKSEAGFTKQIDQTILLVTSMTASLNDKIDDIKTRLTSIDGEKRGVGLSASLVLSIISAIASIAVVISVVVLVMHK